MEAITIYGHYDVVAAAKEDGWDSDPFTMTGRDSYLYGRGVSDDKGPIVATLFALHDLLHSHSLPLNIVFLYEGYVHLIPSSLTHAIVKQKVIQKDSKKLSRRTWNGSRAQKPSS